jgi:signal transduction histidine kinase
MRAVQLSGQRWIVVAASDLTADKHMESALSRYIHQLLQSKEALHRYTADLEGIVREQTEALCVARDAAVAANAAKSEFLANMSHELRTPLHGILSFARFGIKKHAFAERDKLHLYFQRIESSGQTLLKLLNALLDLSKLEARAVVLDRQSLSLGELVVDIVDEFAATLRERDLTADTANIDRNVLVLADHDKLGQVIRNLLANSLKFTPPGGVIAVVVSGSPDGATLEIRDTGPGIPDDDCERVFDKFVQSRTTQTGAGGTGLGLAICREIVELHAGRIRAVPTHGCGALMRVELPRWTTAEPAESVEPEVTTAESEAPFLSHASCI